MSAIRRGSDEHRSDVHARAVLVCDNGVLTFEDVDAHRDHATCTAVVRIRYEEHRIALDQITPYVLDMLGFFEELVSDSAGWPGVKSWRSEATEMRVEARFERGFVRFEIAVRWLAVRDGETWRGRLRVVTTSSPNSWRRCASCSG